MSFLEMYKKGEFSKASSNAFDFLFTNLLVKNKRGRDKSVEVSAMDMESKAPIDFVPSMIYTFLYTANMKETTNGKDFIDRIPIILCFSTGSIITGLNFNMIPNDARASILDLLVETSPETYASGDDFAVNEKMFNTFMTKGGASDFLKYIKVKTGLNVSSAMRSYSKDYIENPRMIEYDMWKYIPYMSTMEAVRGGNLAAIQADMVNSQE